MDLTAKTATRYPSDGVVFEVFIVGADHSSKSSLEIRRASDRP